MAVRNFYVEANVDGRDTTLSGGPKSKTGGMRVKIFQRSNGEIEEALTIRCVENNGQLQTFVYEGDKCILTHTTAR